MALRVGNALFAPLALAALLTALASTGACGTDAVGVDACRDIESARCQQASNCGIDLGIPVHRDARPVEACQRYYHDACLHGLVARVEPGAVQLKACINAINSGSCSLVKNPELDPACAFLVPADVDAGTDAAVAADAAADTGTQ